MQDIASTVLQAMDKAGFVQVEVSAKHVHLSVADMEKLFGAGVTMAPKRALSQPGKFLSEQRVSLIGHNGTKFSNIALLGPARAHT